MSRLVIKEMLRGSKSYVKVPVPVKAIQINEVFIVSTPVGDFHAKAGDFLIENDKGDLLACDKDLFLKTYTPLVEKDK